MQGGMAMRYLFGPVTARYSEECLQLFRQIGECLAFNETGDVDLRLLPGDTWDDLRTRLPTDWQPDLVVLYLPYTVIPDVLWSAPVPVIGLAADWNLLWHYYREALPRCDL